MKKTLRSLFLAAILLGWGWKCSFAFADPASPQIPLFSISLPSYATDLRDLDARDSNNRPIRSVAAKQELKNIFVNNLRDLLLQNLTPGRRAMLAFLAHSWDLVSGWMKPLLSDFSGTVNRWWQKNKFRIGALPVIGSCTREVSVIRFWFFSSRTSFQFLISHLLSSTQILR